MDSEWLLIATALARFLSFSSRLDEAISLFQLAEQKAINANETDTAAVYAYELGWLFSMRGQADRVLETITRVEKFWENLDPWKKAQLSRLKGIGYQLKNNLSEAILAFQYSLDILRKNELSEAEISVNLTLLGKAQIHLDDYTSASENLEEALQIAKRIDNQEGIASTKAHLALLAIKKKEWENAERLGLDALKLAENIGNIGLMADCHVCLGVSFTAQKKFKEGLYHTREAVNKYKSSGSIQKLEGLGPFLEFYDKRK